MKQIPIVALLILPAALFAQTNYGACDSPFAVAFDAGRHLSMHLRAGDVEIVGTARPGLRVTCQGDDDDAHNVKISFAAGNLRTYGGPDHRIRFRIEIPARTNLLLRVTAGDVRVNGITGDKDIELRAGDLTIGIDHPEEYRVAEGSVLAGDLNASAFGIRKDGLFRNFRKENSNGQYRLRAELLAGDLTLK